MEKLKSNFWGKTLIQIIFFFAFWFGAILLEIRNPDWFGYQKIFEDGAWLAEGGKDYGFLFLIKFLKLFIGDDYLTFRRLVDLIFSISIIWFLSSKYLQVKEYESNIYFYSIALIPLIFLRYTVQIREGMALIFVLIAFHQIFKNSPSVKTSRFKHKLLIVGLLISAALIHSGLSVFLFFYTFSLFAGSLNTSIKANGIVYNLLMVIFYIPFTILTAYYLYSIRDSYYTGIEVNMPLTFYKIIYWLILGIIILWNIVNINKLHHIYSIDKTSTIFIRHMLGIIPLIFYGIGLVFLVTQTSNSVLSGIWRIINITMCINIFLLAKLYSKQKLLIALIIMFLIIDQIRVLYAALAYNNFLS